MYTVHFNLYTLYTILTFKVSGSYYTDIEADCQLFHVCVQVSEYEVHVFHILLWGGLIFLIVSVADLEEMPGGSRFWNPIAVFGTLWRGFQRVPSPECSRHPLWSSEGSLKPWDTLKSASGVSTYYHVYLIFKSSILFASMLFPFPFSLPERWTLYSTK